MITQGFGLMKNIPVFHPSGVALRSKSVPDGFVTKNFTMMYCRVGFAHHCDHGGQSPPYLTRFMDLTWIPQLNTDQVRTPPSGEKCGLEITPAVAFTPPVDTGNKQTKQQASQ